MANVGILSRVIHCNVERRRKLCRELENYGFHGSRGRIDYAAVRAPYVKMTSIASPIRNIISPSCTTV